MLKARFTPGRHPRRCLLRGGRKTREPVILRVDVPAAAGAGVEFFAGNLKVWLAYLCRLSLSPWTPGSARPRGWAATLTEPIGHRSIAHGDRPDGSRIARKMYGIPCNTRVASTINKSVRQGWVVAPHPRVDDGPPAARVDSQTPSADQ